MCSGPNLSSERYVKAKPVGSEFGLAACPFSSLECSRGGALLALGLAREGQRDKPQRLC